MTRLWFTNPLAAIKAANKYEAQGYMVELVADGDMLCVVLYPMEACHVA